MKKIGICLLGATGSIGQNVLNIVRQHTALFQVIALTAHKSFEQLYNQCCEFSPLFAVLTEQTQAHHLEERLKEVGCQTRVLCGEEGYKTITAHPAVDKVVSAIVGAVGLIPTLYAIKEGKEVILANKEPLVMAGDLLIQAAREYGARLLPADSEHNAIFQCLPPNYCVGERAEGVSKLILTASGGPFLHTAQSEFDAISPEMACQHPNWKMGKKITVDCATLMNKGLEVIEASRLFGFPSQEIEVVIHPQSLIHSLVEFQDGSVLAQLGPHDMKVPLAYCLSWPKRIESGVQKLSLAQIGQLTFYPPDTEKFKCLSLAYSALTLGNAAPCVLNASNEIAVEAFLNYQTKFSDIPGILESVLETHYDLPSATLDDVMFADRIAREKTTDLIKRKSNIR